MRIALVTYHAPEGDSPVVITRGVRFFDGQPQELNTDEHGDLIAKAQANPHFDVELGEEEDAPRRRGRPPKAKPDEDAGPDPSDGE